MLDNGYVRLYRSLTKWEWYDDHNTTRLFIHLLLTANWQSKQWQGITIEPGQIVTSLGKLAQQTGLSVRQIRGSLDKLKVTGEVTSKTNNRFSLLTIKNYSTYQQGDKQRGKQTTSNRALKGQTNDNDLSIKACKQEARDRPASSQELSFGEFGHVHMSQAEHGKLLEGWDASDVDAKIEALDFNIEQGRKPYISYENHYAAVRGWLKKDCTPRTRPGDLEIKPDTNRPVLQEGMSWAEILDAQ